MCIFRASPLDTHRAFIFFSRSFWCQFYSCVLVLSIRRTPSHCSPFFPSSFVSLRAPVYWLLCEIICRKENIAAAFFTSPLTKSYCSVLRLPLFIMKTMNYIITLFSRKSLELSSPCLDTQMISRGINLSLYKFRKPSQNSGKSLPVFL